MARTALVSTLAVCVLAAGATAWLGFASGLFLLVDPLMIFLAVSPYLGLALVAWGGRRRPTFPGLLPAFGVLVGGCGLFFYYNDWYWPRPTNPNPWRDLIIPVVAIPQWLAVGLAALALLACHLHDRWHEATPAKPPGPRTL